MDTPTVVEALRDCLESLRRLPNRDGAYRVTCIREAELALASVEDADAQPR